MVPQLTFQLGFAERSKSQFLRPLGSDLARPLLEEQFRRDLNVLRTGFRSRFLRRLRSDLTRSLLYFKNELGATLNVLRTDFGCLAITSPFYFLARFTIDEQIDTHRGGLKPVLKKTLSMSFCSQDGTV